MSDQRILNVAHKISLSFLFKICLVIVFQTPDHTVISGEPEAVCGFLCRILLHVIFVSRSVWQINGSVIACVYFERRMIYRLECIKMPKNEVLSCKHDVFSQVS